MNKLVDDAPYHPGYEDAVVQPKPVYSGIGPGRMIWKPKPLSDEEIFKLRNTMPYADRFKFARAIERMHGIK